MVGKPSSVTVFLFLSLVGNFFLWYWPAKSEHQKYDTHVHMNTSRRTYRPLLPVVAPPPTSDRRLTHIVVPVLPSQDTAVLESLELWNEFPACFAGGHDPTSVSIIRPTAASSSSSRSRPLGRNVTLTFFVAAHPDVELEKRLLAAFQSLSRGVSECFSGATVRFSGALLPAAVVAPLEREMFELMLDGWLELLEPSYVLYLEPSCLPVQQNWLSLLDAATRWPNDPFWAKGSFYRGGAAQLGNRSRFSVAGTALYNLGDSAFRFFYFYAVRPWVSKHGGGPDFNSVFFRFLFDPENFHFSRHMAHLFQLSDSIHWSSSATARELAAQSGSLVALACGSRVPR